MAKKDQDEDKKSGKKAKKRGPGRPPKNEKKGKKRGPGRPPKSDKEKKAKKAERMAAKKANSAKRGPGRPPKNRTIAAAGSYRVTVIGNLVRPIRGDVSDAKQGISITYTQGKNKIQRDIAAENVALRADGVLYVSGPQIVAEFVAESYSYEDGIYTLETSNGKVSINGQLLTVEIERLVGSADDADEAPTKKAKKGKKGGKKDEGDLDAVDDEDDEDGDDDDDDDDGDDDDDDDDDEDGDDDSDDEDDDEDDESDDDDDDDDDDSDDEDGDDSGSEGGEWNI